VAEVQAQIKSFKECSLDETGVVKPFIKPYFLLSTPLSRLFFRIRQLISIFKAKFYAP